jgi:hypothetical protein
MPALNSPPGPIGLPLLGVLPQFRADPAGYMLATARKFGEISHFRLGFRHIYLIDRPDVIEEVLVHNACIGISQEQDAATRQSHAR